MGSHPVNLLLRFLLELAALGIIGYWGFKFTESWYKYMLMLAIPLLIATLWATFAVPDDPSRSGNAPVPISGMLRLILEFSFFGVALWALYDLSYPISAMILGIIILTHYIVSYDRIIWLMKQ